MNYDDYLIELGKIRQSRLNDIKGAVNRKIPKEEAGLKGEIEEMYYDDLVKEADELEKEHGFRPVFEMGEIEYDDPILDIYGDD